MKRVLIAVSACVAALLFIVHPSSTVLSQKNPRSPLQSKDEQELAASIRRLTNRSDEGLKSALRPDGGVYVDLDGRFQNVMLARLGDEGEAVAACVTGLEEANSFFGKDLETGQLLTRSEFSSGKAKLAKDHGMSEQEFEFYERIIRDAEMRQDLSPGSASITIVNNDGAGEGFNDASAAFVVGEGGNMGTTKGAQRLNVFTYAASIWGSYLDSSVSTSIRSNFDPLACTPTGAVLGSAGATGISRDFPNAPFAGTWYHDALANKLSAFPPFGPSINARFNDSIDTGCFGGASRFYYGLDNATPASRINLLVVVLHEMGHGLGFSSFVDGSTGSLFNGFPDVYTRFMFDRDLGLYWYQMSNAQRQASATNVNDVLWDGPNVKIASGSLTAGRDAATGRVELYTPSTFAGGSSISHFSTAASPNLLMEPSINAGLPIDLDLARQQMRDIGWFRDTGGDVVPDAITNVSPSSGTLITGDTVNITWTNNDGFNRNVRIELSIDGGSTFPAVIAANTANTGTYSWVVPNLSTTQARLRVREYDFVDPAGVSSGSFAISAAPSSATVAVSGRVADNNGSAIRYALITLTDNSGRVLQARSNVFGYFRFDEVRAGANYVAAASHKAYVFDPVVISVSDEITGLNFFSRP